MAVINTNVSSLIAQNSMTSNARAQSNAMQQLSTGLRINGAKDDAAGLAIADRMSSQIKGLNMAVKNANDAISMVQTADGATSTMSDMLGRMRELAVQSSNDTNTSTDRTALDNEFQQLTKEIARIASNTQWNGMNLLNNTQVGAAGLLGDVGVGSRNVTFQVGSNSAQTINVGMADFSFGTGTAATASKTLLNLGVDPDLKDGANIQLTIGTKTFSTSATAVAAVGITAAETTAIATALTSTINNTVGFENVKVTASGTTITVEDAVGRATTGFSLKKLDGTEVGGAVGSSILQAGVAASGATAPPVTAVFSGGASINDQDIKSQTAAATAITHLDSAIQAVNTARSGFGAIMNRLAYASDNLTNVSQNATASRSRILDTDYAKTSTELARTQIIAQAATAMLAQANQSQQSVLALLK